MRASLICLACISLLVAAGCNGTHEISAVSSQAQNVARGREMNVTVSLPKRDWTIGESMTVKVTVANTTASPIGIVSPTGAPVLVRVMRPSKGSFEQVHVYPEAATSNIANWTLPAHRTRTFTLIVPVEPDWPVAEVLTLTAEINGYPKLSPGVTIMVHTKS